jgi:hypothetical protein
MEGSFQVDDSATKPAMRTALFVKNPKDSARP